MKVVHLYDGHERVHEGRGSVPGVVWNVARETAALGHEVTVLERQWDGLSALAEHEGVSFERMALSTGADEPWERVPYEAIGDPVDTGKLLVDRTNLAARAYRHLRRLEFDVLHVHLPFAANVLVTLAPWLRDRMVYTAHVGELRLAALRDDQRNRTAADGGLALAQADPGEGDDPATDPATDTGRGDEGGSDAESMDVPSVLQRFNPDFHLARRVAHTTVLNPDVEAVFADRGVDPGRLSVIPNGVELERYGNVDPEAVERVRAAYDLGSGPVVLFVGTVMPRKGVDDLVRAVGRLGEEGWEDLQVVIAGEDDLDGAYTARVRELVAELGIDDRVRMPGFVPEGDLPPLYALADVFALCSREEGFGMTVTEAMAAGTPVVATRVGGIPRQVDDGEQGRLVAPNDPGDAASVLSDLLSSPGERKRMARRARDRAGEYAWPGIARRFEAVYEEVVG